MQMELDDMQRKKNDEVQSNRADSSGSAVGRLNVVRKNDFDRLYKKEEA